MMSDEILQFTYQNKKPLLELILKEFQILNLSPQIGVELEFYLQNQSRFITNSEIHHFISLLQKKLDEQNINILAIEPEQGAAQVEVKTGIYSDILKLCADIEKIKTTTQNLDKNVKAIFVSQPFKDDCGSALQINLSLNQDKNNLFAKNNLDESKLLLNAIAGILEFANNILILSAPHPEDYLRFDLATNKNLHKNKKYTAPTNISWGYDNRTALLRIPGTKNPQQRRLEFRLPSTGADIYLTIFSLLTLVKYGIENNAPPPPAIYGNTFDDQYNLPQLTTDYKIAKKDFINAKPIIEILKTYKIIY